MCKFFFIYSIKKFYKHITNYNNYKLRYNTTKTMPQGAKYYVYPAAVLEVIKKNIRKTTYNYYRKGIVKYKLKMRIQAKVACNQIK